MKFDVLGLEPSVHVDFRFQRVIELRVVQQVDKVLQSFFENVLG